MPVFEPSTWAEVEEAIISQKPSARTGDAFVAQVRAFTNAPERFLTPTTTQPPVDFPALRDRSPRLGNPAASAAQAETRASDGPSDPDIISRKHERRHFPRLNRSELQFDDLLGHGRVDLDAQAFVRRYATPSNFKSLSMFPAPSTGRYATQINPSTPEFSPSVYLAKVHTTSTVEQLVSGKASLQQVKHLLDAQADKFRSEKFINAALVEAAFENTKTALLPISPFVAQNSNGTPPAEDIFERAEALLKARYEVVMHRETKLGRLQRSLSVFTRFQWVFTLGSRLRSASIECVADVEDSVREYQRALKWLDAQDGFPLQAISHDIESGFQTLFDALLARLSSVHASRQDTERLVTVLTSVNREDLLTEALSKRTASALDSLQKSIRSVDIAAIIIVRGTNKMDGEVADLVVHASTAFVEGVSHVWRLGRVLIAQDRWTQMVEAQLARLCTAYAQVLRDQLLSDSSLISPEAVREIAGVRTKVATELAVPTTSFGPLEDVATEVIDSFLRALTTSVRTETIQAAVAAVRAESVGAPAAQVLFSIVTDVLNQVDGCALPPLSKEELEERAVASLTARVVRENNDGMLTSSAEALAVGCMEAPGIFAQEILERMEAKEDGDVEADTLKVAVCCTELCRSIIERLGEKVQNSGVLDWRAGLAQMKATMEIVRGLQEQATGKYVRLVGGPLQDLTRGLVSFPDEDVEDLVSRTVPIKIEGVSKGAIELTLQLALVTITTRRKSANRGLIKYILLDLIKAVGKTLVQVLSTDKLAYHRAAQLWVDVTFVQEMVTRGAEAECKELEDALDGFRRVKERAVQAVLADGFSFSVADMQMLKDSVVTGEVEEALMVCECFQETWIFLKEDDDED